MQALFHETNSLDRTCYNRYALTSDILMEHAALAVATYIKEHFKRHSKILLISGSGHNGADAIAVSRLLYGDYHVFVFEHKAQKSEQGLLQKERALSVGVNFVDNIIVDADVIVDGIYGSGLNRDLETSDCEFIAEVSSLSGYKIAIDIPSGILSDGRCSFSVFNADCTITMGALKRSLFSDLAKDYVGKIEVANLGISRSLYEADTNMFVLEEDDMSLPHRVKQNTHKGSFGHACFFSGVHEGASVMAGLAALNFGVGLVTLIKDTTMTLPYELMQAKKLPIKASALCIGMGLGRYSNTLHEIILDSKLPLVIDADLFYTDKIKDLLNKKVILTPHPKEFCSLLDTLGLADIDVQTLQNERFKYVELFLQAFPDVCLLLKGSQVIIADQFNMYINPHGTSSLSKGGSGDVLSGLITALLAQGYEPMDALISASLAHSLAAKNVDKCSYALTPKDLIKSVGTLGRD